MKVVCPSCGEVLRGSDIDLENERCVCRACGELFALPDVPTHEVAKAGPLPAIDPLRPNDLRWTERDEGQDFVATLGQSRWMAAPVLGFAAVWNGFLVVWYTIAAVGDSGPAGLAFWFPLLHVGAGLFITYKGVCLLFNSARFAVTNGSFRFRRGPIPETGNVTLAVEDIRAFTTLETRTNGKGGPTFSWDVRAETKDGRAVQIRLGLPSPDGATYIASRLQRALERTQQGRLTYRG